MSTEAVHIGARASPLFSELETVGPAARPQRWPAYALDELSLKFVISSRTEKQPVLDFGCGDGLVTAAALARGAHVIAMDPDELSIQRLLARVPSQHHRRLRAHVGSLEEADFKENSFGAIHAARVLQDFDAESAQRTLAKFFRWLHPGGRVFISVPLSTSEWSAPGEKGDALSVHPAHLVDQTALCRDLVAAGFILEETRCYTLPWLSGQMCWSAVARCGL